jgi:hypothetical protein
MLGWLLLSGEEAATRWVWVGGLFARQIQLLLKVVGLPYRLKIDSLHPATQLPR